MDTSKKEVQESNTGPINASKKLHEIMKTKISKAVEFASQASIYNAKVTATELTTAQSILLSLMHSLLTNDLGFCISLLELATSVDHLRSSYLPIWLRDDFNFDDQQVVRVLSRAASLVQSGLLIIPSHILKVFVSLAPKYRVLECCRASGNTDTLKFLTEFNLPEYSLNRQSMASSFLSNSVELSRSNSCNISPSITNFRPMGEPFLVDTENVRSLLDDEISFFERTENPAPLLQEVWVEDSETESAQSQTSTHGASSNEFYMCAVREYLKVPDDFNEEEILRLINYSDLEGSTLLHRAVKEANPYVVESMLMLGAKVNEKDTFGSTPSHCAASIGSIPMLQVLAQNRADFSLARNDGCTPLHEAIINGHEPACKWLLDHGSEINVRNIDGWAPLHLAAQWDKYGIVKLLLENGADSKIYSNNGKTPFDVAEEEGHTSIIELLSS